MVDKRLDISLVLTCYNEGAILAESFESVENILRGTKYSWEVICVDDASVDGSSKILKNLTQKRNNFRVYYHKKNTGRGGAVADGIRKAKGKVVGYIDVDLELSPIYIPEFVRSINSGFDLAIGNRVYKESFFMIHRFIASRVYAFLVNKLLKLNFKDTEAGYKFFNRKNILPVLFKVKDKRWFFDTEIVARSYWKGLKIASIPVLFLRRNDKKSTVRFIRDTLEYLRKIWKLKGEMRTR